MQTFLPYPDFKDSLRCLDNKRLGKQRLEAWQLLRTLAGETKGWRNHPATAMWRGYENALILYYNAAIEEWMRRGFRNTMTPLKTKGRVRMPPWLGDPRLHASHRSKLLSKDPAWYSRLGWKEKDDLPYFWPTANKADTHPKPRAKSAS